MSQKKTNRPPPGTRPDDAPETAAVQGNAGAAAAVREPKRLTPGRVIARVLAVLGIFLLSLLLLAFGAITVICKGPFPTARDLFVVSVNETSAVKFLARIYFSEEEVQQILLANSVVAPDEVTDTTKPFEPAAPDVQAKEIEIIELSGPQYSFVGKMMVIQDPSRVQLACLDAFGKDVRGKKVEQFASENGAVAAINAGFFDDPGGVGKGGQPLGLMLQGGRIVNGSTSMVSTIVGFDANHHLVVGKMSGQEALDLGIRDAVTVEPTIMPPLIINGNASEITGTGSGLNPRTALGQRADGAVLMLVIDGRQPHSIGASLEDCLAVMLEFGAVNACMLDGGSSSVMYYEGELISTCSSLYGPRSQPSAWLVI